MSPQTILIDSEEKRERALKIIAALRIDRPLEIVVQRFVARRSKAQNARLWTLHQKAAQQTGMSAEEMHEICLCRFFGYTEKTIGGIIRQIPIERSKTQDKERFREFMDATEAFYIAELGIFLPN